MTAVELIEKLRLAPHPEGGWYREVFRSTTQVRTPRGIRAAGTTIYYLLEHNQISRWHVVEPDEIWHFYAGAPLELLSYDPGTRTLTRHLLGSPENGGTSVAVIPAGIWQAARVQGPYSLVGCTVTPGFDFSDFKFISSDASHKPHFESTLSTLSALL